MARQMVLRGLSELIPFGWPGSGLQFLLKYVNGCGEKNCPCRSGTEWKMFDGRGEEVVVMEYHSDYGIGVGGWMFV